MEACLNVLDIHYFVRDQRPNTVKLYIEVLRARRNLVAKDEAADALSQVIQDVADPEGICIGKIRCDGEGEFRGSFQALAESYGIPNETNACICLEEILSQSVVLAPSLVLRAAYF